VTAGHHWFTDWGRDTMISLEGLTLVTGRHTEAGGRSRSSGTRGMALLNVYLIASLAFRLRH
jgi:hypothetical protein